MSTIESTDDVIAEVARCGAWYRRRTSSSPGEYFYGDLGDTSRPAPARIMKAKLRGSIELKLAGDAGSRSGRIYATGQKPKHDNKSYQNRYVVPILSTEIDMRPCMKCRVPFLSITKALRRCPQCESKINIPESKDRRDAYIPKKCIEGSAIMGPAAERWRAAAEDPSGLVDEIAEARGDAERKTAGEWQSIADAARWPEGSVVVERQVYADDSLGVRNFQLHEFWRPDLRVSHTEWLLTQGVISGFKLIAERKGGE